MVIQNNFAQFVNRFTRTQHGWIYNFILHALLLQKRVYVSTIIPFIFELPKLIEHDHAKFYVKKGIYLISYILYSQYF